MLGLVSSFSRCTCCVICLLLVFVVIAPLAHASSVKLKARVFDEGSGRPVNAALVYVQGMDTASESDARGYAWLTVPGEERFRLTVSQRGYRTLHKSINTPPHGTMNVYFPMVRKPTSSSRLRRSSNGKSRLKIRLFDTRSKEPIAGAKVRLGKILLPAATDASGRITLSGLPTNKRLRLTWSHPRYQNKLVSITLKNSRTRAISVGVKRRNRPRSRPSQGQIARQNPKLNTQKVMHDVRQVFRDLRRRKIGRSKVRRSKSPRVRAVARRKAQSPQIVRTNKSPVLTVNTASSRLRQVSYPIRGPRSQAIPPQRRTTYRFKSPTRYKPPPPSSYKARPINPRRQHVVRNLPNQWWNSREFQSMLRELPARWWELPQFRCLISSLPANWWKLPEYGWLAKNLPTCQWRCKPVRKGTKVRYVKMKPNTAAMRAARRLGKTRSTITYKRPKKSRPSLRTTRTIGASVSPPSRGVCIRP